jgi:hypothetical protein
VAGVYLFTSQRNQPGLISNLSNFQTFKEERRYEPGRRKNQEYTMVGRVNRPVNFGNSRGIISAVYILVGSFLSSLLNSLYIAKMRVQEEKIREGEGNGKSRQ